MDLETVGQHHAPGYRVAMSLASGSDFDPGYGAGSRFRLVWVRRGTGLLRWGGGAVPVLAPALLCLNETPGPDFDALVDFEVQILGFHPSAVNGAFTFESIRGPLESTAAQDRDWLWPFLQSQQGAPGLVSLGPHTARQIARLMGQVTRELVGQPDSYWPCRARSYLLELLIFVDRLFQEPEAAAALPEVLPGPGTTTAEVLTFLHTHYAEPLTLARLCQVFHTNHTSLTRKFRRETGESPMAYLVQLRLRVAASILRDTTLPMAEIAERVGFQDGSYFGRAFAKNTGFRPSEYRQAYYREPL